MPKISFNKILKILKCQDPNFSSLNFQYFTLNLISNIHDLISSCLKT
jgi:hypothetical protein